MDQEMKDNLQDLRDIRKQMDQYYGIGQEYIRKEQIFERYSKADVHIFLQQVHTFPGNAAI